MKDCTQISWVNYAIRVVWFTEMLNVVIIELTIARQICIECRWREFVTKWLFHILCVCADLQFRQR